MSTLDVFEPAMCCPSGVCGVDVDPVLAQFGADLQALAEAGVTVQRHSLSHAPQAFAAQPEVLRELQAGVERLPIVVVDGRIASTGVYPGKLQMMRLLGLPIASADKPHIKLGACGCAPCQC